MNVTVLSQQACRGSQRPQRLPMHESLRLQHKSSNARVSQLRVPVAVMKERSVLIRYWLRGSIDLLLPML